MADIEGTDQGRPSRKPRKGVRSRSSPQSFDPRPSRPSPTERLESARDQFIRSLEEDKRRLLERVDQLQAAAERLGPENAQLKEALGNAVANNVLATILVAIGGGSISFATFVEGASKAVAYLGVAVLIAGVLVLISPLLRGRGGSP